MRDPSQWQARSNGLRLVLPEKTDLKSSGPRKPHSHPLPSTLGSINHLVDRPLELASLDADLIGKLADRVRPAGMRVNDMSLLGSPEMRT